MTKTIDFDQPLTNEDIEQLYRDGKLPRAGMQFLKQLVQPRDFKPCLNTQRCIKV